MRCPLCKISEPGVCSAPVRCCNTSFKVGSEPVSQLWGPLLCSRSFSIYHALSLTCKTAQGWLILSQIICLLEYIYILFANFSFLRDFSQLIQENLSSLFCNLYISLSHSYPELSLANKTNETDLSITQYQGKVTNFEMKFKHLKELLFQSIKLFKVLKSCPFETPEFFYSDLFLRINIYSVYCWIILIISTTKVVLAFTFFSANIQHVRHFP